MRVLEIMVNNVVLKYHRQICDLTMVEMEKIYHNQIADLAKW